jgi:hypothetical protein
MHSNHAAISLYIRQFSINELASIGLSLLLKPKANRVLGATKKIKSEDEAQDRHMVPKVTFFVAFVNWSDC